MCRRRYQQNTCNYPRHHRRSCCSSRRNRQLITYSDIYDANPAVESRGNALPGTYYASHPEPQGSQRQIPHVRGPFSMAAALILGLSLGAQKIQEKREKKKEKKALMEFANEQREAKLRSDRASRNAVPEYDDRRRSGSFERYYYTRNRSVSLEREGEEVPPPSYEEVTRESAGNNARR